MDMMEFDLNKALSCLLDNPLAYECEYDASETSAGEKDEALNDVIDNAPDAFNESLFRKSFDVLVGFLKSFGELSNNERSKTLNAVLAVFTSQLEALDREMNAPDTDSGSFLRVSFEMSGFLILWSFTASEQISSAETASGASKSKGARGKAGKDSCERWVTEKIYQSILDVMARVPKVKLSKLWTTTSERDNVMGLFMRSIHLLIENDTVIKVSQTKLRIFKFVCLAVKHQSQAPAAQVIIIQSIQYYEHLAEPMAELLLVLAEQYDHTQLTEEILRELSSKEFNANDLKGPKFVSTFLLKISQLLPRVVLKQMTSLIFQLNCEAYAMRCAMIEVCENLISYLSNHLDESEIAKDQLDTFFEILEERVLDINPYVRSKVLQVYTRIADLQLKFPKRRQRASEFATRALEDRSSFVRRSAIKALTKFISTHPYGQLHGAQLSHSVWYARLQDVLDRIKALNIPESGDQMAFKASDEDGEDAAMTSQEPEQITSSDDLMKLQLTRRYYQEALKFIDTIHCAACVVEQLLSSKTKAEVIEAMDFFVVADAFSLDIAKSGIKKMMHLVWTKANNDENKGVKSYLLSCYKGLFFDVPESLNPNAASNFIARNLVSLTFGSSLAELVSLEELMREMMKENIVSDHVVQNLWRILEAPSKEVSARQRKGSLLIITMLARAKPEIITSELDTLLRIGLGAQALKGDCVIPRLACIGLQRIRMGTTSQNNLEDGSKTCSMISRFSGEHPVLLKLCGLINSEYSNAQWFGLAEQALNAIYHLGLHPDIICGDLIRQLIRKVFDPRNSSETGSVLVWGLSRLLFVAGHVAVRQLVYIELCEADFKRRKSSLSKKSNNNQGTNDELDLIGGTSEDDFVDAVAMIREKELLYGSHSLLRRFGPMVVDICSSPEQYSDTNLQISATLALSKFMCVSSEFCDTSFPLFLSILENANNPTIRNNFVIALGDMAVCFNRLVDENTESLYGRLGDEDASVKKTCLMTLTSLILAGQIKVKGQLGAMAKCLEDEDRGVSDLAKMFFSELATKDNAIYNGFVDIFSGLSLITPPLEEHMFKRIIKFLTGFIEKEKHAKQLSEKMAVRLPRCETERQWNDVVYTLSLLPHKSEEVTKVVTEGFKLVAVAPV